MKKTVWLPAIAIAMSVGAAGAQSPAPPAPPPIPTTGVHPRLQIINQCTNHVWAIFTPGGDPSQVTAQQNSGDWFRAYAQQEQFTGTGATAEAAVGTTTVTVDAPPNDTSLYFLPGQFIEIVTSTNVQDSTPGPTAMITDVSSSPVVAGTVLTLDRALTVPPDPGNPGANGKAQIWIDTLVGAVQIPAQTQASGATSGVAGGLGSLPEQGQAYGSPGIIGPGIIGPGIISQGMRSPDGSTYSQGMMANSGPWAGRIYSEGMQAPDGIIYSQGTQITIRQGATYYQPAPVNPSPPPAGNPGRIFQIPDKGAPSGRFSFFMGCPKNDTDPLSQGTCALGAATTELASVNTLAEVSFGCMYSSDPSQPANQSNCAFNPGNTGPGFPNCQANPNAASCGPLGTNDYYDVSAVDGYTFPIRVDVQAQASGVTCNNNSGNNPLPAAEASVDGSMLDLSSCPAEDAGTIYSTDPAQQQLINGGISLLTRWNAANQPDPSGQAKACVAPYQWFEQDLLGSPADTSPQPANCSNGACTSSSYYAAAGCDGTNPTTLKYACPQHSGPQQRVGPHLAASMSPDGQFAIHNTNYVRALYALGYKGYTWQFDDGVGLLNCPSTAAIGDPQQYTTYTITVCPNGGANNPVQPARWVFSPATGTCVASSGMGAPGYSSLALCQQANMRYVCDDVTQYDPYQVPNALWRADPRATRTSTGYSWAQVAQIAASTPPTCQDHDYPAGISPDFVGTDVKLPLCTYYYGGGASLCPGG